MEFAGKPMIISSFCGETLFAPVPGSTASNSSRDKYNAYLEYWRHPSNAQKPLVSFMEWVCAHDAAKLPLPREEAGLSFRYEWRARELRGAGLNKLRRAIGVKFAWELLDIFIGSWCCMFVPHRDEREFLLKNHDDQEDVLANGCTMDHRACADETPEGTAFLKAALAHPFFRPSPSAAGSRDKPLKAMDTLVDLICMDLKVRGIPASRRQTFVLRVKAIAMLLDNTGAPEDGKLPAAAWSVKRCTSMPARVWSPQQQDVAFRIRHVEAPQVCLK